MNLFVSKSSVYWNFPLSLFESDLWTALQQGKLNFLPHLTFLRWKGNSKSWMRFKRTQRGSWYRNRVILKSRKNINSVSKFKSNHLFVDYSLFIISFSFLSFLAIVILFLICGFYLIIRGPLNWIFLSDKCPPCYENFQQTLFSLEE